MSVLGLNLAGLSVRTRVASDTSSSSLSRNSGGGVSGSHFGCKMAPVSLERSGLLVFERFFSRRNTVYGGNIMIVLEIHSFQRQNDNAIFRTAFATCIPWRSPASHIVSERSPSLAPRNQRYRVLEITRCLFSRFFGVCDLDATENFLWSLRD